MKNENLVLIINDKKNYSYSPSILILKNRKISKNSLFYGIIKYNLSIKIKNYKKN